MKDKNDTFDENKIVFDKIIFSKLENYFNTGKQNSAYAELEHDLKYIFNLKSVIKESTVFSKFVSRNGLDIIDIFKILMQTEKLGL
ncbi:hypothetical protein BOFE_08680 (plasmid) [Candidatus Borrelia fainii]|uniref:Uncharacterized protein n=1 Tax=Candidatus Borrelia fainii TaxID=2518322 RepID=A0ABM8DL58_9SPIR|nr:hypothetical protein [Candidatus Borrelia fainii]BDU63328.1 hypothetical protein BOFE_08680 [Candidatus Borrelia fainii]